MNMIFLFLALHTFLFACTCACLWKILTYIEKGFFFALRYSSSKMSVVEGRMRSAPARPPATGGARTTTGQLPPKRGRMTTSGWLFSQPPASRPKRGPKAGLDAALSSGSFFFFFFLIFPVVSNIIISLILG